MTKEIFIREKDIGEVNCNEQESNSKKNYDVGHSEMRIDAITRIHGYIFIFSPS